MPEPHTASWSLGIAAGDQKYVETKRYVLLRSTVVYSPRHPLLKKIQHGVRRPFKRDPRNQVRMMKAKVLETTAVRVRGVVSQRPTPKVGRAPNITACCCTLWDLSEQGLPC